MLHIQCRLNNNANATQRSQIIITVITKCIYSIIIRLLDADQKTELRQLSETRYYN